MSFPVFYDPLPRAIAAASEGLMRRFLPTLMFFAATTAGALAQNYVTTFGDYGWYSDDTRDGSVTATGGANELLGLTSSHSAYGTGSAEDDLLIAQRIAWETPALNAPNGLGALHLSTLTPSTGRLSSGKATLSLVDASTGFAAASVLTSSNFYASLTYYNPANKQLALRINVQSTLWTGALPTNILGENTWDLALVYVGNGTGAWTTDTLSQTSGLWSVYKAGNSPIAGVLPEGKTLAQLAADPIWGQRLFGEGAKISNIQVGVGSSSTNTQGYVSAVQLSFLNGGRPFEFVDDSHFATVTEVAPVYSASTAQVYQVTGTVGAPTDTVAIANTGTTGEATTFSVQNGATLVAEQVTVEAGGVLTGSGVIEGSVAVEQGGELRGANNVTGETRVAGGARHAPGFSPAAVFSNGNYVLNEATLEIEIGGTAEALGEFIAPLTGEFDQLFYADGIELSFATIEIAQWNGFTLEGGETFNIMYAPTIELGEGVTVVGVGAFSDLEFHLTLVPDASFGLGTYQALQVEVVPEPSTLALLAAAVGIVFFVRRRATGRREA